mmetsp:Transcript_8518/g.24866  ORF Transcript_8518/g.24866 Transcript_8518/m.24866 type:complete len:221 (-) Transcript_8518:319-981(-)
MSQRFLTKLRHPPFACGSISPRDGGILEGIHPARAPVHGEAHPALPLYETDGRPATFDEAAAGQGQRGDMEAMGRFGREGYRSVIRRAPRASQGAVLGAPALAGAVRVRAPKAARPSSPLRHVLLPGALRHALFTIVCWSRGIHIACCLEEAAVRTAESIRLGHEGKVTECEDEVVLPAEACRQAAQVRDSLEIGAPPRDHRVTAQVETLEREVEEIPLA